jgi:hypothetical protein
VCLPLTTHGPYFYAHHSLLWTTVFHDVKDFRVRHLHAASSGPTQWKNVGTRLVIWRAINARLLASGLSISEQSMQDCWRRRARQLASNAGLLLASSGTAIGEQRLGKKCRLLSSWAHWVIGRTPSYASKIWLAYTPTIDVQTLTRSPLINGCIEMLFILNSWLLLGSPCIIVVPHTPSNIPPSAFHLRGKK